MRLMRLFLVAIVPATLVFGEPISPAFHYQGQLKHDGVPVNEDIDLMISIWDAEIDGEEIYNEQFPALTVENGLFNVEVAGPADLFAGDTRWLEVMIRYPATTGDWSTLTPREKISTTPYSSFALASGDWVRNGVGLSNRQTGFVGINRDYPIGSEVFGIHSPSISGYGGMYVSTEGGDGRPFYGYYTPVSVGWHYMDGPTGNWHLSLNGINRMTVSPEGNVGIGNESPDAALHVGSDFNPTVSGSAARINGVLAVNGTIVSDEGNILSRAPSSTSAAVVQIDSSNTTGGEDWHLVSHGTSSPYGGTAGSVSFYNNGTNLLSLDTAGRLGLGTVPTSIGKLTIRQSIDNSTAGIAIINSQNQRSFRQWVSEENVCRIDSGSGTGLLALNASGGNVGISTATPEVRLHVGGGVDASNTGGGYFMLGNSSGVNLVFDNNEMIARNNGAVAHLHMQADGGEVRVASNAEGTVRIGSSIDFFSTEGGSDGAQFNVRDAAGNTTFEMDAEENGGGSVAFMRNSSNVTTLELDSDESDHGAFRINNASGGNRIQMRAEASSAGRIDVRGNNGNYNSVITRHTSSSNHGWMDVSGSDGLEEAGMYVDSSGNGIVFGDTKNFRVDNPRDPETDIWYASLEGPEAAAYSRGTAQLVNGRAVISMPDHFVDVCSHTSITLHLTPRSMESKGLAFVGFDEGGAVVRELSGGTGSYAFDYLMIDVRAGHENYKVIRPKLKRFNDAIAHVDGDDTIADMSMEVDDPQADADEGEVRSVEGTAHYRPTLESADQRLTDHEDRIAELERMLAEALAAQEQPTK